MATDAPKPAIDYLDLEMALHFLSDPVALDPAAWVSRATGRVYWSEDSVETEPLPDDLDDEQRYAAIPSRRDLDLGTRLVRRFVDEHLPDHAEEVAQIFRKRGAYGRFKDFLDRNARLAEWHAYEDRATSEALCEWAREEGFTITGFPSPTQA